MNVAKCLALGFLICVVLLGYQRIMADAYIFQAIHFSNVKKDWSRTLMVASEAYRINQHDKTPLAIIGRTLILTGNKKSGITVLEKYIKSYPYDLNGLVNLGIGYLLDGRFLDAYEMRERVKAISPKYANHINPKKEG